MQFFNTISYTIGGYTFALNEIENGVLRSNRKAIGAVTKPFSKSDPRLKVALPAPEPKIHFALVCGAKSCPPIKTYTSAVRFFFLSHLVIFLPDFTTPSKTSHPHRSIPLIVEVYANDIAEGCRVKFFKKF